MIESSVYARVGIAGNPSDGFYGKTLSACIKNFKATVRLEESDRIEIVPDPMMDPLSFDTSYKMVGHADKYGYYGALRLLNATCCLFWRQIKVRPTDGHGFRITYESDIPRQVGLGGSSALVVALLNCLIEFHGIEGQLSLEQRAHMARAVEHDELGIECGFQDRVVQTYGGLVFMDFDRKLMEERGYGEYEPGSSFATSKRPSIILPPAFLAYTRQPRKISGTVHNAMRERYNAGDSVVIGFMDEIADTVDIARTAILWAREVNVIALRNAMAGNLLLRRELYGDEALGEDTIRMIDMANRHGLPVKLPGSGGAVIGLYESEEQYEELAVEYRQAGYECTKIIWDDGGQWRGDDNGDGV